MSLTKEQLDQAAVVLENMRNTADDMRNIVMTASDAASNHITLTPEQVEELKALYLQHKPELVELYNQLPG